MQEPENLTATPDGQEDQPTKPIIEPSEKDHESDVAEEENENDEEVRESTGAVL